jgi:hypothetical protein
MDIPNLSFFITRKVKDISDNYLWIQCVKQIRNFYKYEPIFIIDDCNDIDFITNIDDINDFPIYNIHFLNTDQDLEIKGSGEIASFYYYLKMKVSKKAFFIHDNFSLLNKLDIDTNTDIRFLYGLIDENEKYKSLVNNLILNLNEAENIIDYKYKYNWLGCYENSCLISIDYLLYLEKRYQFFIILKDIKNKLLKDVFQRLFGLLITYDKKSIDNISFFGIKNQ